MYIKREREGEGEREVTISYYPSVSFFFLSIYY